MFECLEQRICFSLFYDFDVIAKTDGSLTSILPTASINDSGQVAFVGATSEGQSVYVGTGTAAPTNITFAPPSSTRTYGQELQINNAGQVAAVDRTSGSTVGTRARVWEANAPGTFSIIARGTTPPSPILPDHFDILSSFTTISNDGNVALSALDTSTFEIHMSKAEVAKGDFLSQVVSFETGNFFRFTAADGDRIVVGSRNTSSGVKQITLYDKTGVQTSSTIASVGSDWQDLGVRPGISDDGRIVTFYGDEVADVDADGILGPGIFASVERAVGRSTIRLASITDGFSGFAVDQRIGVSNMNEEQRMSSIVFQGTTSSGSSGIFLSQLKFQLDSVTSTIITGFTASKPSSIIENGESIAGLGVVNSLAVHDSTNNKGDLAFWADTTGGQAILKAKLPFQRIVLAWGVNVPVLVQQAATHAGFTYPVSAGSMPAFVATPAYQESVRDRVEQQFFASGITRVEVVIGQPQPGATVVYFTSPLGGLLGKAFSGVDRFNRRSSDSVVVMVQSNLETDAETVTHEVGHSLGLRHIDPPGSLEVMDYDATNGDIEIFSNSVFNITEPPQAGGIVSSNTHNPVYHLKRFIEGSSSIDLSTQGSLPGTWDLTNSIVDLLTLNFGFKLRIDGDKSSTILHNVYVQAGYSEPDSFSTIAFFVTASLTELEQTTFSISDGMAIRLIASTTANGPFDISLASGDPKLTENVVLTPSASTQAYALQQSDPSFSTYQTLADVLFTTTPGPTLFPIGNRQTLEGNELTFTAAAVNSDPGAMTSFSLVNALSAMTIDSSTGVFRWTPAETDGPGSFTFTVRVTDNGSPALTDEETITVTVNEVNQAPVLTSIGNKSLNAGSSLDFNALATDDDLPANTLTYSLVGETNGASINSSTGAFSWTPTTAQGTGNFQFTVRVTDNGTPASFDEEQITVTVQALPTPPNAANDVADLPFGIVSTIDVLINDTPAAGGTFQNATLAIDSTTLFGTIRVSPNGRTFEYTSEAGFFGGDRFTYRIVDSSGVSSNIATVTINVASSSSEFSVSPLGVRTPDLLIGGLLATGSGITVVNGSAAYVGTNSQSGLYTNLQFGDANTNTQLRAGNGILLTTGTALVAIGNQNYASNPGNDNATIETGTGNDFDLAAIAGRAVTDANSLTFDFTVPSNANSIRFDLIFGTEEFPDFVVAGFNDIMGVFLDGVQIAFDSTGAVFSVDNNFFVLNNSGLQTDPTVGKTVVNFSGFEYDGITTNVTTTAPLNKALTTHKLKFVIADSGDRNLDSAVFLSNLRAVSDNVIQPTTGGSVAGRVIDDADGDGVRDSTENGLAGQTVYIDTNGNGILDAGEANAQTDLSGNYLIESIPPGNIVLRMNLPNGKSQTFPGGPMNFTLLPGQDIANLDFGQFSIAAQTGVISGVKFNDLNGNGIRDRGLVTGTDPDVVFVIDVSGSTADSFGGTAVGDLNSDGRSNTILDAEIAGFIALTKDLVSKGLGQIADVSVVAFSSGASGIDLDPITAGTQRTTKAGSDKNSNGILDVEEALRGLSDGGGTNFEVALREAISIIQSLGTTPENGNVVFLSDGVPNSSGAHTDETAQLKTLANNVRAFGVGTGASLPQLQIIDSRAVQFTTTDELLAAFQGVNSGGGSTEVFTEPGLPGVTIYIDTNNNGRLDVGEPRTLTRADDVATTTVDELGSFQFTQLPAGTYILREVVPAGFTQTRPAGPNRSYQVVLTATAGSGGNDFGNTTTQATNSVSGYVYADVDNDGKRFVTVGAQQLVQTGLPNVKVQLINSISGAILETLTGADGFYEFLAVPNGTYDLVETQPIIFVDGKDTEGVPSLLELGGTVAADRFNGLNLTGGIQATEYNFGERGLKAAYVTKSLLLASTPDASALAAQYDTNARFVITASDVGLLTITGVSESATAQLFSTNNQPLPLVANGPTLSYRMGEGESVYLVVENERAGVSTLNVKLQPMEQMIPIRIGANTNSFLREDVDGDGGVSPLDALLIINRINTQGIGVLTSEGPSFVDVDRDGSVSPLDALAVINRLNRRRDGEGEQNGSELASDVFAADTYFGELGNSFDFDALKRQRKSK